MGVVTADNLFSRSIGSAVGIVVFGAIANAGVGPTAVGPGAHVDPALLAAAVHHVFIGVVVVALLAVVAVVAMPGRRALPVGG